MAHLNRQNIGKTWPVERKGTKYLAVSSHNQNDSIPLIVVIRDILKLARTKKELKKVLNEKQIFVNGKEIREVNFPLSLFDVLSVPKMKKNYKLNLNEHKKMVFEEVSDKDASEKVFKIIGKKVLGKSKLQLNLINGRNVIVDGKEKINVDDSVVVNFKDGKVSGFVKMEKGKTGFVYRGKHAGISGKIEDVIERGGKKLVKLASGDEKINVWIKSVVVMEK